MDRVKSSFLGWVHSNCRQARQAAGQWGKAYDVMEGGVPCQAPVGNRYYCRRCCQAAGSIPHAGHPPEGPHSAGWGRRCTSLASCPGRRGSTGPSGGTTLCPLHFQEGRANEGVIARVCMPPPQLCPGPSPRPSPAEALTMQQGLPSRPQSGGFCTHLSPLPQKAPVAHMGGTSLSTENP